MKARTNDNGVTRINFNQGLPPVQSITQAIVAKGIIKRACINHMGIDISPNLANTTRIGVKVYKVNIPIIKKLLQEYR